MERRCRLEVEADILSVARGGARKTAIVYKANLNFRIVKGYLARLLHEGRLRQAGRFYHTTPEGLDFLGHRRSHKERLKMSEVQKEPRIVYKTLSSYVLVVAKQGAALFDWAAYIFPVPGNNHDSEWRLWKTEGSKLRYDVARILFPDFDTAYSWRP